MWLQHSKLTKKFTPYQRKLRVALSYVVIFPLVVAVVIGCTAVLVYRSSLMMGLSTTKHVEFRLDATHELVRRPPPPAADATDRRGAVAQRGPLSCRPPPGLAATTA